MVVEINLFILKDTTMKIRFSIVFLLAHFFGISQNALLEKLDAECFMYSGSLEETLEYSENYQFVLEEKIDDGVWFKRHLFISDNPKVEFEIRKNGVYRTTVIPQNKTSKLRIGKTLQNRNGFISNEVIVDQAIENCTLLNSPILKVYQTTGSAIVKSNSNEIITVSIFTLDGRRLFKGNFTGSLDISEQVSSSGIYFISDGRNTPIKLVIVK